MPDITVKPMESPAEIEGKAYVHWKSCHEAYQELMGQSYLDNLTLESCTKIAYQWTDHLLVAKDGEKVVGFVGYGPYRGEDLPGTGEVAALYVLSEYYGKRVGQALLEGALEKLSEYEKIVLWVLKGNGRAARFYEKFGFQFDGTQRTIFLGKECTKRRMIVTHPPSPPENAGLQDTAFPQS